MLSEKLKFVMAVTASVLLCLGAVVGVACSGFPFNEMSTSNWMGLVNGGAMFGVVLGAKSQAVATNLTRVMQTTIRNTTTLWPSLATRVPSSSDQETYGWLADVPGMKEALGERIFEELRAMNYSVRNKTWRQSLGLKNDIVDDDRYGLYRPAAQKLATKAARHPDQLMMDLIVNGETGLCYDGQPFYDTDHSEGESGVQSNLLTSAVVDRTAPTVLEFQKAFHAALIKMFTYKTDQGDNWLEPEAIGLESNNLVLLVPLSLWEVADKAMTQMVVAEGGAGTSQHILRKARVVPAIRMGTESNANGSDFKFDLIYNGDIIRPFVFQDRDSLRFQTKGVNDIEDEVIKVMSRARYNVGYGLWQYAVRTELTTA